MSQSSLKLNYNNLERYINHCLIIAIDRAAEEAVEFLADYIDKNWYSTYDTKVYVRTQDFLKSASKTDAKIDSTGVTSTIFFDINKIKPHFSAKGKLNQHTSFSGKDKSDKIPMWIEFGNEKMVGRPGKALGSMEETIKMLQKRFPSMVQKYLRMQGLKITVR